MWLDRAATVATAALTIAVVASVAPGLIDPRIPRLPPEVRPIHLDSWNAYRNQASWISSPANDSTPTIIVFSDYACEYCAAADTFFRRLAENAEVQVALGYRHAPLSPLSRDAAIAAVCAERSGHFQEMHLALFEGRREFGRRPWTEFAKDAEIADTAGFTSCLSGSWAASRVDQDIEVALSRLGMRGTPAFLLDSLFFRGTPSRRYVTAYLLRLQR